MNRWPPMLGVVGLDFGYKPAIALAVPISTAQQPDETDSGETPPDDPCAEYPDDLEVLISGVFECEGCPTNEYGYIINIFTGINDLHAVTRTAPGASSWSASIGSVEIDIYPGADCSGDPETFSGAANLLVGCSEGLFTATVTFNGPLIIFQSLVGTALEDPMANDANCASTGNIASGGSLTVAIP